MSYLVKVLQTPEAKVAICEGILELFLTRNLNSAINKMLNRGKQNGSLLQAKIAFLFDLFSVK